MDYPKNPHSPPPQQETEQHHPTNPIDPWASPLRRNVYRRQSSLGTIRFADEIQQHSSPAASIDAVEMEPVEKHSNALGIITNAKPISISRVQVGSRAGQTPPTPSKAFFSNLKSPDRTAPSPPSSINPYFSNISSLSSPPTPGSGKPFLSHLQSNEPESYSFDREGLTTMSEQENGGNDITNGKQQNSTDISNATYDARRYPEHEYDRDGRFVYEQENGSNGNFNGNDNDKASLLDGCPAKHDIYSSRNSWLSVSFLILSMYSTVFSGIYLILALVQPRYGWGIHTGGRLPPSTASTLFAMVAKTIELSFVTVFITFLGQVLSRRSLIKASRGVTIAELTMRTWVIQPGFMITHWQTLQHAGLTILGVITITAALMAMLYTTASNALVSPHLKYGGWQKKLMYGLVKTSYADALYVANTCRTPVKIEVDSDAGTTCLSILHVGQAQHNYVTFLDKWTGINIDGRGISSDLSQRPQAPALIFDNTTVTGSWIMTETSNVSAAYKNHSRIINNVTMAMPHAGVIAAARQERNAILQPEELDGVGEYSVRAAVVSPAINVLCANMNAKELAPLVYDQWPHHSDAPADQIGQPGHDEDLIPVRPSKFLNTTVVDDIFEWGESETYSRQPPIFAKFPIEYNSIVNISAKAMDYASRDSIYLLIKAPDISTQNYTLCRIRSFLSPNCSTHYNVSGKTGGKLISNCEDPNDENAYYRSAPDAPTVGKAPDWMDVGSTWMSALSLGTGITNANASISRLLSQLVIVEEDGVPLELKPVMPSLAESLAVLAGSTLLVSSTDATFKHSWNYSSPILEGQQMSFSASLASQEYTSGPTQNWQSMFYLVLLLVFCTNVFCLIYFIMRAGLVTDYTEPQNLFALAVNSPPSKHLEGSCGTGPEGDQFNVDWHVSQEDASGHFFIKNGPRRSDNTKSFLGLRRKTGRPTELKHSSSYSMLSSKRKSWL
ncbi:hypothetical protein LSUB1_G006791 [Lachnellula subtilissima]|uniref:Uncharacterized protein n=1 Tax=Lachnellula subtilissima TaxID=602034 RepID=A0A8H8RKL5_9HELO|nr:hypothetical protein LSUB1_G006791 [Lachnellula subtilissima]